MIISNQKLLREWLSSCSGCNKEGNVAIRIFCLQQKNNWGIQFSDFQRDSVCFFSRLDGIPCKQGYFCIVMLLTIIQQSEFKHNSMFIDMSRSKRYMTSEEFFKSKGSFRACKYQEFKARLYQVQDFHDLVLSLKKQDLYKINPSFVVKVLMILGNKKSH